MIRPARESDVAAIAAIWTPIVRETALTFLPEPHSDAAIAQMIATAPVFLVAEQDGALAGFVKAGPFRSGQGYRHSAEHTILLAPRARGQGTGRALMAALEARLAGQGCHALVAGISAENPEAVAFHARLGFTRVGHLPEVGRKFDRWIDLLLMQKLLSPGDPR